MYKARSLSKCTAGKLLATKRCFNNTKNIQLHKLQSSSIRHCSSSTSKASGGSGSSSAYIGGSVVVVGLLAGGAAVYANYDEGFRQSLEDNVPFVKPMLDSLYGDLEHKTKLMPEEKDLSIPFSVENAAEDLNEEIPAPLYPDQITTKAAKEKDGFANSSDFVVMNTLDSPGVSPLDLDLIKLGSKKKKVDAEELSTNEAVVADNALDVPEATEEINSAESAIIQEVPEDSLSVTNDTAEKVTNESISSIDNIESEVLPDDIPTILPIDDTASLTPEEIENLSAFVNQASLEALLDATTEYISMTSQQVVQSQKTAEASLKDYVNSYIQAISLAKDDPMAEGAWKNTSEIEVISQSLIDQATLKISEMKQEFGNLKELIATVTKSGQSEIADKAETTLKECSKALEDSIEQFNRASSGLEFISKIHTIVDQTPENIQKGLRKVLPELMQIIETNREEINYETLAPEEALLGYVLKRGELLNKEIENMDSVKSSVVDEMLIKQKEELISQSEEQLKKEIESLEKEHQVKHNEKLKVLEEDYEREILSQLKRQANAHTEHLSEQLSAQSQDLTTKHHHELESKINDQRLKNQLELERQLAFIQGIQTKISEVVHMDEKQRRTQELWIASQALNTALKDGLSHGRTRSLMPEILSILHLAGHNTVIEEIVASVPTEATSLGVVPEKELLARFEGVKSACKKVALVGDEGGALPLYALSYIKSLFVFSAWYKGESNNEIDVEQLGPYEILAKAEYFIQNGDLEQATKFMSQLKGVSRKLCNDWLKEARLYLETKQTATLLMAYASSLSVAVE